MWNSFGEIFRVTTFGESHCKAVGAIIDGCPPRIKLTEDDIQAQLDRRKPGQNMLTTQRKESDTVTILSGTEDGTTLGSPISVIVPNSDQRPGDYSSIAQIPRPSHADYTYIKKYGIKSKSGGGRTSARETIARVAGGAIAEKVLKEWHSIEIVAWVSGVGSISCNDIDMKKITRTDVDKNIVRCPNAQKAQEMIDEINRARMDADSIGGIITCVIRNVPAGVGNPVFGRLEARLAASMLSIPATKGFSVGSGFEGVSMRGSEHNDLFTAGKNGDLETSTNYSGGIQGGITNGQDIYFKTAFKPVATIGKEQQTVNYDGKNVTLAAKGRHDPCVVARAVPIVEGMAAITILDALLVQRAYT